MSGQTLIFCVGATRSGTSWLHSYLRDHPDCFLRAQKELHYFDELHGDWPAQRLPRKLESLEATDRSPHQDLVVTDLKEWLQVFDGRPNDTGYLDYVGYGRVKARVVGDFTPAYGLLDADVLAHMAGLCDDVKFIYLMREPVERLWSNIKMSAKPERVMEAFLEKEGSPIARRSDYSATLENLRAVVPEGRLHVEYFERLFTEAAIDRLCEFLDIPARAANLKAKVHPSDGMKLNPMIRDVLQARLQPQYEYVAAAMGGLPEEWTEKMVKQ